MELSGDSSHSAKQLDKHSFADAGLMVCMQEHQRCTSTPRCQAPFGQMKNSHPDSLQLRVRPEKLVDKTDEEPSTL